LKLLSPKRPLLTEVYEDVSSLPEELCTNWLRQSTVNGQRDWRTKFEKKVNWQWQNALLRINIDNNSKGRMRAGLCRATFQL
jgi:hypothetical protein